MSTTNIEVAKRIKGLLEGRGITNRQLSRKLGITESILYHILNGRSLLRPDLAITIAEMFGVTLDEIYGRVPLTQELTLHVRVDPTVDLRQVESEIWQAIDAILQKRKQ
jgi:transcriptional regulator with XRE-family HTH domain